MLTAAFLPALPADAVTVTPVADSYVDSSRTTTNYGGRSTMRVDDSPVRIGYMKFDVTGDTSAGAQLRIFVENSNELGIEVYAVPDTTWNENTITWSNRPALGSLLGATAPNAGGVWLSVDVSEAVTSEGLVSLALLTADNTATRISSREGSNPPELHVPPPPPPTQYDVSRLDATTYESSSPVTGTTYTGSLKAVVESAVNDLNQSGGGDVNFASGDFDLGSDHFEFYGIVGVNFIGQGPAATTLRNVSNAASDTEPFDFVGADDLTVSDMTVSAGGSVRLSSDALDFDNGNSVTVERVHVTASRGRGIVFDGKNEGGATADGNIIRDCSISDIPSDGVEFLASSDNEVTGCVITDVGGHAIQMTKASSSADQPNKPSNNNLVANNTIDQAGQDGININSGNLNQLVGNTITNSADDTANRDGIRVLSFDAQPCDDNVIDSNSATDNQAVKTQRYGLDISSPRCNRTIVRDNDFSGNLVADIKDNGTGTIYETNDTEPPTVPQNVSASASAFNTVDVAWDASTDNVAVDAYLIHRDGVEIDTVDGATSTYQDTSAAPSTTYSYQVAARDAAGNTSGLSDPAAATTPGPPSSFTVESAADSWVDANAVNDNNGTATTIRVDGSPDRRGYVRFDVSGVSGAVTSATLRVHANANNSGGYEVQEVTDTWDEATITYANAPTFGPVLGSSGATTSGAYNEVDVTGHVTGDGSYSFALTPTNNTNLPLATRESSNPPELVVVQDTSGNTPPTADDVVATTDEDTVGAWTPSVSDPDPDTLTCQIASQPGNGSASVASDCSSGDYTPDPDSSGADSFTYEVSDGSLTDVGTVDVTVTPVNDAPTADDLSVAVTQDTATTVTVTGSDVDSDCPLTFAVATPPANGSLGAVGNEQCAAGAGSADVEYTPDAGYTGPDSFAVTVTDPSSATSAAATITISVDPPQTDFTFAAAADSWVDADAVDANNGTKQTMRVDGSPDRRGYVRFDVSGVSGAVTSATLRVHANSTHSQGFEVQAVTNSGWSESAITYANAPTFGPVLGSSGATASGVYSEVDVTGHVTGDGSYSFALTPTNNTNLPLATRESTNPPELVIETAP